MNELIQIAFSPVNLIYTFMMMLILLYWMAIIIGALDFGSIDVDFDLDTDLDIEVDADVEVDSDLEAGGTGGLVGVLHFFNFGKLPFMVIMSFLTLFLWTISILANYYLGDGSILFALALFFPNLFISLCLTKMITTPLIPVFEKLDAGQEPVDYIGLTCKLILPASASKMGQAEVMIENNSLLVNVKAEKESQNTFNKGDEAIIVRKEKNKPLFVIEKITDNL